MRTISLAAAIAAFVLTAGCKKTGEGEYQVEKPVIGSETDTVETPSVETGSVKDTISVPDVDVKTREEGSDGAQGGRRDPKRAGAGTVRQSNGRDRQLAAPGTTTSQVQV